MIRITVQDELAGRALSLNVGERAFIRIQSVSVFTTDLRTRPRIVGFSLICRSCKTAVPVDASYCTECGRPLRMRTNRG